MCIRNVDGTSARSPKMTRRYSTYIHTYIAFVSVNLLHLHTYMYKQRYCLCKQLHYTCTFYTYILTHILCMLFINRCAGKANVFFYSLEPPLALALSVGWTNESELADVLHSFYAIIPYTIYLKDLFNIEGRVAYTEL